MRILFRKFSGVSMFEVLLVMVVASFMAVGAMRYAKRQQQIAADQIYGQKLYVYGQAVSKYIKESGLALPSQPNLPGPGNGGVNAAYNNPAMLLPVWSNGITTLTITGTGVDWLKKANAGTDSDGVPYLDDNFSFEKDIAPLSVALPGAQGQATALGNASISAVISLSTTAPTTVKVIVGALYERQSNGTLVIKPDLTNDAIQRANTLYTPQKGLAAIAYDFPYLNPTTGVVTPSATVSGTVSPSATSSVEYLRTDGGNMMEADLNFDPKLTDDQGNSFKPHIIGASGLDFKLRSDGAADAQIINTGKINFGTSYADNGFPGLYFASNTGNSTIVGGGTIDSVTFISFNSVQNGSSMMIPKVTGLTALEFGSTDDTIQNITTEPYIQNLKKLSFDGAGSYHPAVPAGPWVPKPNASCLNKKLGGIIANPAYPCNCTNASYRALYGSNCVQSPPAKAAYTSTSGSFSQIDGLNRIIFTDESNASVTRIFKGIAQLGPFCTSSSTSSASIEIPGTNVNTMCYVSSAQFGDNGSGRVRQCKANYGIFSGTWNYQAQYANECCVRCIRWD